MVVSLLTAGFCVLLSEMTCNWPLVCVCCCQKCPVTDCWFLCAAVRNVLPLTVGFCVLLSEMPRDMRSCHWCRTNPTMWIQELSLTSLVVTTNLTRSVTNSSLARLLDQFTPRLFVIVAQTFKDRFENSATEAIFFYYVFWYVSWKGCLCWRCTTLILGYSLLL